LLFFIVDTHLKKINFKIIQTKSGVDTLQVITLNLDQNYLLRG